MAGIGVRLEKNLNPFSPPNFEFLSSAKQFFPKEKKKQMIGVYQETQ